MPQNKAKLESNGSMTFEPLKPGAPAPVDGTVPHAYDQVLPDTRPGVQQPTISPTGPVDELHAVPGTVKPGQYKRPTFTDLKKA